MVMVLTMKLYATITNSTPVYPNGKTVGLGHDNVLLIELKRGNKTIGRVKMECYINNGILTAGREYDIKFFPITEATGKGGYILLHEEKVPQAKKLKGEDLTACENHSHYEFNCPECKELN